MKWRCGKEMSVTYRFFHNPAHFSIPNILFHSAHLDVVSAKRIKHFAPSNEPWYYFFPLFRKFGGVNGQFGYRGGVYVALDLHRSKRKAAVCSIPLYVS
jgi:hypothetical protein